MRILVTGSRTWDHVESIRYCLDALLEQAEALNEPLVIVHGACPTGADQIADEWCLEQGRIGRPVRAERHPAKWSIHGKRAGFLRNDSMAARCGAAQGVRCGSPAGNANEPHAARRKAAREIRS